MAICEIKLTVKVRKIIGPFVAIVTIGDFNAAFDRTLFIMGRPVFSWRV